MDNFIIATEERSGIQADRSLMEIKEILSGISLLSNDTLELFQEKLFFETSMNCIDPDHPTLLHHVLDVYNILSYHSSTVVNIMKESEIIRSVASVFLASPFQLPLFDAFMLFFTNISDDSPESRLYLVELHVFDIICELLASQSEPQIVGPLVYCLYSFFPQNRTPLSDDISFKIINPLKAVLIKYFEDDKYSPEAKNQVILHCLQTFELFCTSKERIRVLSSEGVLQLLLDLFPQLGEVGSNEPSEFQTVILETISIVLSACDMAVLSTVQIDIRSFFTIKSHLVCDILEGIILTDESAAANLIQLGAVDYSLKFTIDGKYDEHVSAITFLSSLVIAVMESDLPSLATEEVITALLNFYVEGQSSTMRALKAALDRIYVSFGEQPKISQLYSDFSYDIDHD